MHLPISVHELASATRTGSSDPKNQRPIADLGKRPTALDVLLDKSRPIQPHPIQRCRLANATGRDPLYFGERMGMNKPACAGLMVVGESCQPPPRWKSEAQEASLRTVLAISPCE